MVINKILRHMDINKTLRHIVINKTLHRMVTENRVLTGPSVCVCPRPSSLVFQDAAHAVIVSCSLLSKGQYLPSEYYVYIVCLCNHIV